jgi:hypothetical protein
MQQPFEICDGAVCTTKVVDGFGLGGTEPEARAKAEKNCADFMTTLIILNNINSRASVGVPCRVTSCRQ